MAQHATEADQAGDINVDIKEEAPEQKNDVKAAPDVEEPLSAPQAAAAKLGIPLDQGMSALSHVPVEVQVVLGGARMPIGNVLKLSRGAVV